MRDYSKVAPQFWIGATGKRIRKAGAEAQLVALYLLTSPHANMIGLYHLPVAYITADTGIPIEGASKALARLSEAGFCGYDDDAEVVWVYHMARFQIGEQLKPGDRQCAGAQNTYDDVPENRFLPGFFDKYASAFNLTSRRGFEGAYEGASKALRSQEQEQEQEQDSSDANASLVASNAGDSGDSQIQCPHKEIIDLYAKTLAMLPQPRVWEGQRADNLRTRWRWVMTAKKPSGQRYATTREEGIEFFDRFFRYVAESDFLTGRNDAWHGCDLAWLVKAENFAKVIEGKYENKEAA